AIAGEIPACHARVSRHFAGGSNRRGLLGHAPSTTADGRRRCAPIVALYHRVCCTGRGGATAQRPAAACWSHASTLRCARLVSGAKPWWAWRCMVMRERTHAHAASAARCYCAQGGARRSSRTSAGRALRASWTPFYRGAVLAIYLIRTSEELRYRETDTPGIGDQRHG